MKNQNETQTIMSAATKTDRNLIHDVCDVFSLGSQILKFHSLKEITLKMVTFKRRFTPHLFPIHLTK